MTAPKAFGNLYTKTGKGRQPVRGMKVKHVEDEPCVKGTHTLSNNAKGVTYCTKCKVTWVELDIILNDREKKDGSE